jgi:hypothetical protein
MQITCACGKRLRLRDDLLGKRVKCPGCGEILLAEAPRKTPREDEAEDQPSVVKRKAPRRDEDDEEPRPLRRSRKQATRPSPVVWLALGGGGVVLVLAVVIALVVFGRKSSPGKGDGSDNQPADLSAGKVSPAQGKGTGNQPADDTAGLTGLRALKDVRLVAYSSDGKHLATLLIRPNSGTFENLIQVWDMGMGQETAQIKASQNQPYDRMAFSPDGKLLAAACGSDREMKVWDVGTRALRHKHQRSPGKPPALGTRLLDFSPDGKKLVSMAEESIVLMDVETGRVEEQPVFFVNQTAFAACSPVAPVVAVAGAARDQGGKVEGFLILYDYTNKSLRNALTGKLPTDVAFSRDGSTLAPGQFGRPGAPLRHEDLGATGHPGQEAEAR